MNLFGFCSIAAVRDLVFCSSKTEIELSVALVSSVDRAEGLLSSANRSLRHQLHGR
jgi:hypothetical protein